MTLKVGEQLVEMNSGEGEREGALEVLSMAATVCVWLTTPIFSPLTHTSLDSGKWVSLVHSELPLERVIRLRR